MARASACASADGDEDGVEGRSRARRVADGRARDRLGLRVARLAAVLLLTRRLASDDVDDDDFNIVAALAANSLRDGRVVVCVLGDGLDFGSLGDSGARHSMGALLHGLIVANGLGDNTGLLVGAGWLVWLDGDSDGLVGDLSRSLLCVAFRDSNRLLGVLIGVLVLLTLGDGNSLGSWLLRLNHLGNDNLRCHCLGLGLILAMDNGDCLGAARRLRLDGDLLGNSGGLLTCGLRRVSDVDGWCRVSNSNGFRWASMGNGNSLCRSRVCYCDCGLALTRLWARAAFLLLGTTKPERESCLCQRSCRQQRQRKN